MYNVSSNYKTLVKQPSREFKYKIVIDTNTVIYEDKLVDFTINDMAGIEGFEIGNAISKQLNIKLIDVTLVSPKKIEFFIGLDINGDIEYLPMGVFWVDSISNKNNVYEIICYDTMIKAESIYYSALTYPATITQIVNEIAGKLNTTLLGTLPAYTIQNSLSGYTYREVLSLIAGMLGKNVRFTRENKIEFYTYTNTTETFTNDNYIEVQKISDTDYRLDKITVVLDDAGNTITAGTLSADGKELVISNPFITQTILNSIHSTLNGFTYTPYKIVLQSIPYLDVGDKITVNINDTNIVIPIMQITHTPFKTEIFALSQTQGQSEYTFKGTVITKVERIASEQVAIKEALIEKANITDLQSVNARIDNLKVDTAMINDLAVTSAKIGDGQITNAKIADASISTAKIQNGAITTALIGTGAVGTAQIADGSITDAKIVSLTANKITAGTIDANKVNIVNLKADNIVAGALTIDGDNLIHNTAWLNDASYWTVTTGKWTRDTSVKYDTSNTMKADITGETADKWYAIYSEFIPATAGQKFVASVYSYTDDKTTLDRGVDLAFEWYNDTSRISTTSTSILPTNNNTWQRFIVSGTAPTGTTRVRIRCNPTRNGRIWVARPMLQRGSVASEWKPHTDEQISTGAITSDKIANSAVDANKIANNAIQNNHISANSITGDKIVAGAITADKIASRTITANEIAANTITAGSAIIADGAITTVKIADGSITNAKIADLDATKITTGALTVKDGVNGAKIFVKDASNKDVVVLDTNGITVNNGAITVKDAFGNIAFTVGTDPNNNPIVVNELGTAIKVSNSNLNIFSGNYWVEEDVNQHAIYFLNETGRGQYAERCPAIYDITLVSNDSWASGLVNISTEGDVSFATYRATNTFEISGYSNFTVNGSTLSMKAGFNVTRGNTLIEVKRGSDEKDVAGILFGNTAQASETGNFFIGHLYDYGSVTPNLHISTAPVRRNGSGTLVAEPIATITTDGKMGLGTMSPDTKLHVVGELTLQAGSGKVLNLKAGSSTDHIYMAFYPDSDAQSTRYGWIGFGVPGNLNMSISQEADAGLYFNAATGTSSEIHFNMYTYGDNNRKFIMNDDGTSSNGYGEPTLIPHADAFGYVGTPNRRMFKIYSYGGVATSSNIEEKADILPADTQDLYETFKSINFYTYKLNSKEGEWDYHLGAMVQDLPYYVQDYEASTGEFTKSLGIYEFSAFIGAVVKELQNKVEELTIKIQELNTRLGE
ncbi:MAG: hypothetical protein JG776_444 [Caloramator sp.]|jgi:hypothetical protein|uniref:hypothetical protein n=1 Tax=Caloramator sp. TaxID=1871330 RepID=UPI001D94480E|nr:hypothetical protein [Caloramator sp.]MBZ4662762.1 hypothetical protein [Caloramator sp.]